MVGMRERVCGIAFAFSRPIILCGGTVKSASHGEKLIGTHGVRREFDAVEDVHETSHLGNDVSKDSKGFGRKVRPPLGALAQATRT